MLGKDLKFHLTTVTISRTSGPRTEQRPVHYLRMTVIVCAPQANISDWRPPADSAADAAALDGPEQLNQLLYARDELMNRYA